MSHRPSPCSSRTTPRLQEADTSRQEARRRRQRVTRRLARTMRASSWWIHQKPLGFRCRTLPSEPAPLNAERRAHSGPERTVFASPAAAAGHVWSDGLSARVRVVQVLMQLSAPDGRRASVHQSGMLMPRVVVRRQFHPATNQGSLTDPLALAPGFTACRPRSCVEAQCVAPVRISVEVLALDGWFPRCRI